MEVLPTVKAMHIVEYPACHWVGHSMQREEVPHTMLIEFIPFRFQIFRLEDNELQHQYNSQMNPALSEMKPAGEAREHLEMSSQIILRLLESLSVGWSAYAT